MQFDITLIVLQANTARVIFSWNDVDPTMPDGSDAMYHTTTGRGSASVNLLGGIPDPPPEPSDSETFFIGVDSVSTYTNNICFLCNHQSWSNYSEWVSYLWVTL